MYLGWSVCVAVLMGDLSDLISQEFRETLSIAASALVTQVETRSGWGDITVVTVHVGVSEDDAPPTLSEGIREVIDKIGISRRHLVYIHWAR